ISVAGAVVVAVGGRAHVAPFARQPGPAALRRGDYRIEDAERVSHAVVAEEALHARAFAQVERDRAGIADAVEHRDEYAAAVFGEGRGGVGEPGVVVV